MMMKQQLVWFCDKKMMANQFNFQVKSHYKHYYKRHFCVIKCPLYLRGQTRMTLTFNDSNNSNYLETIMTFKPQS